MADTPAAFSQPYRFDLAVALRAVSPDLSTAGIPAEPGYDNADSSGGRQRIDRSSSIVIEKGQEAVKQATRALASQIVATARQVSDTMEKELDLESSDGMFALESVEMSFGITLTSGVQALFTAQAESSAQVTITISRSRSV
jgi:hypothetical protein